MTIVIDFPYILHVLATKISVTVLVTQKAHILNSFKILTNYTA